MGYQPQFTITAALLTRVESIAALRERIQGVGGRFEVRTSPGEGTTLSVEVPVRPLGAGKHAMSLKA